jgi:hypothetical protein
MAASLAVLVCKLNSAWEAVKIEHRTWAHEVIKAIARERLMKTQ